MGFPRFSQGPERSPNKKARHTEALGWLPYAGLGTERALVVLLLAGTGILALVLAVLVLRLVVLALVLVVLILAVLAVLELVVLALILVLVLHSATILPFKKVSSQLWPWLRAGGLPSVFWTGRGGLFPRRRKIAGPREKEKDLCARRQRFHHLAAYASRKFLFDELDRQLALFNSAALYGKTHL